MLLHALTGVSEFLGRFLVSPEMDTDEKRRSLFFAICILICVPALVLFSVDDLISGNYNEAIAVLFMAFILIGALFLLRYLKKILPVFRVIISLVLLLLAFELSIGGGNGYAFVWFYCLPITIFCLFGKKEGPFWVLLSLAICLFVFFFQPIEQFYSLQVSLRFIVTYSIVALLSYGLETSRHNYYSRLHDEKISLEKALAEIKSLRGILPLCCHCKKIRDDKGFWEQVDVYLHKYSQADISHGVCPDCIKEYYQES